MAVIKSTVVLDDKYSSKAEKIASSTNAMSEAMKKSQSVASKMTSALKSAFSRSHKVKISEVGSKETRAKIYKLNNDLKSITGKPLNFEISAKTGKIEHIKNQFTRMKSGVNSLSGAFNNKLDKGFGKLTKFTSDISSFHKAKKEARSLSKELTKMTGQKHKIKIDMENPIKKGFANLKSGIGNMFSKMNPKNWFGGSSAPVSYTHLRAHET